MAATADRAAVNPGTVVADGVQRVLELARTWLAWGGTPRVAEDGTRVYTPGKAIRRHADHPVDRLAEIEALLAGAQTEPDRWQASNVTLASDWAPFTEADLTRRAARLRGSQPARPLSGKHYACCSGPDVSR
jgi:hypothetical protein